MHIYICIERERDSMLCAQGALQYKGYSTRGRTIQARYDTRDNYLYYCCYYYHQMISICTVVSISTSSSSSSMISGPYDTRAAYDT